MRFISKRDTTFFMAFVVLAMGLSTLGWLNVLSFSRPGHADLQKLIEAKADALVGKGPTMGALSQQEAAFRLALSKEDFKYCNKIVSDVIFLNRQTYWISDSFKDFMEDIVDYNNPSVLSHLDAWVRENQNDPLPLLIRAQYEYSIGWNFRGHDFYSNISAEDLQLFQGNLKKARSDVDSAFKAGRRLPAYAYYLKFRVLQNEGTSDDRQIVFQEAIRDYPDFYPVYSLALSDLQPKWGGRVSAMYKFVNEHAGRSAQYASLRLLYLDLYANLVDVASIACSAADNDGAAKSACMSSTTSQLINDDLKENVHKTFLLYDHGDKYQFGLAIRQSLEKIMTTRYAGSYAAAILQMAATAMSSDTRLIEDHPGRNDYVIDELVASFWYHAWKL